MYQFHGSSSGRTHAGRPLFKCFVAAFVALATLFAVAVTGIVATQPSAVGASEDAGLDLRNWINSVTMEKRTNSWDQWTPATGDNIKEGDALRFNLEYTVPAGQLNEDNRTLNYWTPFDLVTEESGTVRNNAGKELGTYVIKNAEKDCNPKTDKHGCKSKISITFNPDVAVENANGSPIDGYVRFQADVNSINDGNGGKFDFNDSHSVTINVKKGKDLTITKGATQQGDDGTIKYDITVTSTHGTSEPVTITDKMTNNVIADNPQFIVQKVQNNIWQDITSQCTVVSGSNVAGSTGFKLQCPKMEAGVEYHISYLGKADLSNGSGKLTAANDVTGSSKDHDGKDITDESHAEVTWDRKPDIDKKGKIQDDGRTKWTVTINKTHVNLKGWTLKDVLSNKDVHIDGDVEIKPGVNGWTGKLPFTFPDNTTESYTVTYYTTAPTDGQWVSNQATLTPPSGNESEGSTGQGGVHYNPVEKTGGKPQPSTDLKTVTLPWTVTIKPKIPSETLEGPWKYKDTLSDGQWFTQTQQDDLRVAVNSAFTQAGLKTPDIQFTGDPSKPTGFAFTVQQTLGVGKSVSFSYSSTATMPDYDTSFTNSADADRFNHSATITVKPAKGDWKITKVDAKNNQAGGTQHEYYQLDCAEKQTVNGKETCKVPVLRWQIQVDQQNKIDDYADLTVTETLPDGLKLVENNQTYPGLKLTNLGDNGNGIPLTIPGNGQTATSTYQRGNKNYTIKVTRNDPQISITIPKELLAAHSHDQNDKKVQPRIEVNAMFTDDTQSGDWSKDKVFNNTVKLQDGNGKDWGESHQSQTITKDENYDALKKTAEQSDDDKRNNILPYQLVVNPQGNDLDPTKDTITLTDVLEYQYNAYGNNSALSLSIVPDSVKVCVRGADGECPTDPQDHNEKLYLKTPDDFTYTSKEESEKVNGDDKLQDRTSTLTFTLPDRKPLIVFYQYRYTGATNSWDQIKNTASISGKWPADTTSHVQVQESSAGANLRGISLYKVDAANQGTKLSGAVFDLYRWKDGGWQEGQKGLKVGDDGQLALTDQTAGITYNVAYKLVETKAPDGYVSGDPYYFIIPNADEKHYPLSKPSDSQLTDDKGQKITLHTHNEGDVIYFSNSKKNVLPETGGMGTQALLMGGLFAVTIGAAGLALGLRDRHRSRCVADAAGASGRALQ